MLPEVSGKPSWGTLSNGHFCWVAVMLLVATCRLNDGIGWTKLKGEFFSSFPQYSWFGDSGT